MKNGELFEGDTVYQVWPEQKKLEPLYFWNFDAPKITEPLTTARPSRRNGARRMRAGCACVTS